MMKRVGILTSGGDCPGLNATIRGAAKALYQRFGSENHLAKKTQTRGTISQQKIPAIAGISNYYANIILRPMPIRFGRLGLHPGTPVHR